MNSLLRSALRLLAMFSMTAIIAANFFPPGTTRSALIIAGCIGMSLSPFYEKHYFFACLQFVALSGAVIALTQLHPLYKMMTPVALALIFIIYFYKQGMFDERYQYLGGIGITLLGLGYSLQHPLIYLFGGAALAVHSTISYRRGITIAIYWAILNMFFVFAVLYNIAKFSWS